MRLLRALVHAGRRWASRAAPEARDRLAVSAWPVAQAVIAGTLAWLIALRVTDSHTPLFAPIAAVVALNASGVERGTNAVRLLIGVAIGILVGELSIIAVSGGYERLAVAVGVSMAITVVAGAARAVIGQAVVSAVLTVTFAEGAGLHRLADAAIGAGVALVLSQLLFPVRVVAILRHTEAAALEQMSQILDATGRVLDRDETSVDEQTVNRLGDLSQPIAELTQARENSHSTIRHSTIRWGDLNPILREDKYVDQLIFLGESCLTLARTAAAMSSDERRRFAPMVCEMAAALGMLAEDLNNRTTRQRAVDRALEAARPFGGRPHDDDPLTVSAHLSVLLVATDIMLFAGIDPDDVEEALQREKGRPRVTRPVGVPWLPWVEWRPRRSPRAVLRSWHGRLADFVSREERGERADDRR